LLNSQKPEIELSFEPELHLVKSVFNSCQIRIHSNDYDKDKGSYATIGALSAAQFTRVAENTRSDGTDVAVKY